MELISCYHELGPVVLPAWQGRQMYMHTFDISDVTMPEGYEDYVQPVKHLCNASGRFSGIAHLTVDEKIVTAGNSQRRPGPHVDGRFMRNLMDWSHHPGWNHNCNMIPVDRMAVIVASDVAGCTAWEGIFEGTPRNDGDLTHIHNQLGEGKVLPANYGFLLSPDCVHQSNIFMQDTKRVFLRIALED
jgi:hypothetical protein